MNPFINNAQDKTSGNFGRILDDTILVSMDLSRAQALVTDYGLKHRINQLNGKSVIVTCDLDVNRVNFGVVDGVVISTSRG